MYLDFIIIPLATLFIAQSIKLLTDKIKGNYSIPNLVNYYGGMPSTHTAFVASLGTLLYLREGINSVNFAIWLAISLIIVRDALGMRQEISRHSRAIKKIATYNKIEIPKLTDRIGHRPVEVLAGFILGVVITIISNYILINFL